MTTNDTGNEEVFSALETIPLFADVPRPRFKLERLAGLTNRNYKVTLDGNAYVLRIAGAGTSEYINREVEAHNARTAALAGVNAEVLHFDVASGLMLCRYLEGCVTMSPQRFNADAGAPARAALALKRMHTCKREFKFHFEPFKMIDDYLGVLRKLQCPVPDGYTEVVKEAGVVREIVNENPVPLVPCHCDPLSENFLDNGERMWIVDWEYSGMNDPYWDLGDVSVEAAFGPEQDRTMMTADCGGPAPPHLFGRMVMYKAMCDLLWTLWGLIQFVNKNPADDFWTYSVNRFERCKRLMGSAEFPQHLQAVRHGE